MLLLLLQVEQQLAELGNLLPDLVGKMDRARADVLYELMKDQAATAERLLALRELLPRCNVSALVAGHPRLMLGMTVGAAGRARAGLNDNTSTPCPTKTLPVPRPRLLLWAVLAV